MGFDKDRDFDLRLIDYAGAWLSRLTYMQSSLLVMSLTLAVFALDYNTMEFELCVATLYVIPISIACWSFGSREGLAVTVVVTVLAFMKYPLLNAHAEAWIGIYNGVARMVAFFFNAAVVLGARRLYKQMHFLARQDRMTKVLNKAAFDSELDLHLQRARMTGTRLLLTFVDLDGFKTINDQFGHAAGDNVLRLFTDAVRNELRASDLIGRLGGDEFGTLSVIAHDEDARAMAERLHRRFSEILGRSGHAVTCSMGAVVVPAGSTIERDDLLREADRLMYRAKHSGKNALHLHEAVPPSQADGYPSTPNVTSNDLYFLKQRRVY
jgi:diguanylate cyclase (GGDEF)-like protein